jgi:hypothetical protein
VNDRSQHRASRAAADEKAGREADLRQLRERLSTAPAPYLEGALGNPRLSEKEMLLLLRNHHASPKLLTWIGRDHRWTRSYEVKKHLVRHPRVPVALARAVLPHLFWKDLAEVAGNPRVHPAARRQAEEMLKVRIEELTLGERVALARRAPRGLIGCLIETREAPVLRGLLGNNRLVELEAVRVAAAPCASAELFQHVADHPRWGIRRAVRLALLGNPRTPVPVALQLVEKLSQRDLRQLVKDAKVPKIVRVGADRRLARASTRPDAGSSRR